MIEITLPWPDKRLNPNVKGSWYIKYKAAEEANTCGYLTAYENGLPNNLDTSLRFEATYNFYPPDRRRRDQDNHLGMMKNYVDGFFHYMRGDDSQIKRTILEWGDVTPGGKVVLTLEELDNDQPPLAVRDHCDRIAALPDMGSVEGIDMTEKFDELWDEMTRTIIFVFIVFGVLLAFLGLALGYLLWGAG